MIRILLTSVIIIEANFFLNELIHLSEGVYGGVGRANGGVEGCDSHLS